MAVALVGEGDGGGRRWSGGEGVDTGGWGMEAAVAGSTYQNPVEAGSSGGCWVGVGRRRGQIRVPEKEAPEYWLSVLQYLYMKLVCVPSCRAVHI
uniref:Uncharacterized protein n=1 Tax=Oryza sativa subsp. japonica TaxID=39947 RepID=Q109C0_ORYSJ|nr:hypothetical protein LOC_Os10g39044 [Oryza sativa Japonica Group]